MMYWIVFAGFTAIETITDTFLSFWFPFYNESKLVLLLWLLSPATRGSSLIYRQFIHPTLLKRENYIDNMMRQVQEQGCRTMAAWSRTVLQYITTAIMQTAIQGGGGIIQHLKSSYNLTDVAIRLEPQDRRLRNRGTKQLTIDNQRKQLLPQQNDNPLRNVDDYFPEMDSSIFYGGHRKKNASMFPSESLSSGYSSRSPFSMESSSHSSRSPFSTESSCHSSRSPFSTESSGYSSRSSFSTESSSYSSLSPFSTVSSDERLPFSTLSSDERLQFSTFSSDESVLPVVQETVDSLDIDNYQLFQTPMCKQQPSQHISKPINKREVSSMADEDEDMFYESVETPFGFPLQHSISAPVTVYSKGGLAEVKELSSPGGTTSILSSGGSSTTPSSVAISTTSSPGGSTASPLSDGTSTTPSLGGSSTTPSMPTSTDTSCYPSDQDSSPEEYEQFDDDISVIENIRFPIYSGGTGVRIMEIREDKPRSFQPEVTAQHLVINKNKTIDGDLFTMDGMDGINPIKDDREKTPTVDADKTSDYQSQTSTIDKNKISQNEDTTLTVPETNKNIIDEKNVLATTKLNLDIKVQSQPVDGIFLSSLPSPTPPPRRGESSTSHIQLPINSDSGSIEMEDSPHQFHQQIIHEKPIQFPSQPVEASTRLSRNSLPPDAGGPIGIPSDFSSSQLSINAPDSPPSTSSSHSISKCPHCYIHSWLPHSLNCPKLKSIKNK